MKLFHLLLSVIAVACAGTDVAQSAENENDSIGEVGQTKTVVESVFFVKVPHDEMLSLERSRKLMPFKSSKASIAPSSSMAPSSSTNAVKSSKTEAPSSSMAPTGSTKAPKKSSTSTKAPSASTKAPSASTKAPNKKVTKA